VTRSATRRILAIPRPANAGRKKWKAHEPSALFTRWSLDAVYSRPDLSGLRKAVHSAQDKPEILLTKMRGAGPAFANISQGKFLPSLWKDIRNSCRAKCEWKPRCEILFA
jgi:hypothetical protein